MKKQLTPVDKTENILNKIGTERVELKERQSEINAIIDQLKSKVINLGETNTDKQFTKYGAKTQSVSERMELIKAFVELQKLSVDINKTVITTYEREFKMTVDLSKYLDTKTQSSDHKQALSPSDVIKMVKKSEKQI